MAKSKLHTTFTQTHVYSDSAGTCHFLLSPWEVKGAPDDSHCPSNKVKTVIEPA